MKASYRCVAVHVPAAADARSQAAQVDGRQTLLRQAVAQAAGQTARTLAALCLGAVQGDLQHSRNFILFLIYVQVNRNTIHPDNSPVHPLLMRQLPVGGGGWGNANAAAS